MTDQKVLDYIRNNLSKNFSEDQIRNVLLKAGYSQLFLNEHFDLIKKENLAKQNIPKHQVPQQQSSSTTIQDKSVQNNQEVLQINNKKNSKLVFTIVATLILIIAIVIFFIYVNSLV